MRTPLLLLGLTSCSLVFPALLPDECATPGEILGCQGAQQIACVEGFISTQDCEFGACQELTPGSFGCKFPLCGDTVLDPTEGCDDGNLVPLDGCDASCQVESCGNGELEAGEECDDDNNINGDGCDATCVTEFCGDGAINNTNEACDDANNSNTDECLADCSLPSCGDGFIQANVEDCDPPNGVICDDNCQDLIPLNCGNNTLDAGEGCDDGNNVSGDGCSAVCIDEFCGDGATNDNGAEQCDDGNVTSGDGCSAACIAEFCGDGITNNGNFEECDLGGANADNNTCTANCRISSCGDGLLLTQSASPEACDDGNQNNNDGCEDDCTFICGAAFNPLAATQDPVSGSCYVGFPGDFFLGWTEAEFLCEEIGGYLTRIDSPEENNRARAASPTSFGPWIGFQDFSGEAFTDPFGYTGVDGLPLTFHSFASGEPNNTNGSGLSEDCVHYFGGSNVWNDLTCFNRDIATGFICELEIDPCGDRITQRTLGEECDDGNQLNNDGCSSLCLAEPGCGTGVVEAGEQCDDTNTINGDGCSDTCLIEAGHLFESEPNDDGDVSKSITPNGNDFSLASFNAISTLEFVAHGAFSTPGDEDSFQFTNTTASSINLSLRVFVGGLGVCIDAFDPVLLIRDDAGAPINQSDDEGIDLCPALVQTIGAGQTLFLHVLDFEDSGNLHPYILVGSLCGDGIVGVGEQCDDTNLIDGDGCSSLCLGE